MAMKIIIGVMGPGETARPEDNELAYELGTAIARQGWVVLTGGRKFGVMEAAMKGADDNKGLTIGILPGATGEEVSRHAQIRIYTDMGSARNNINVLTSHVLVVIGMAAGTLSEVALAIKANQKIILMNQSEETAQYIKKLGSYRVITSDTVEDTIHVIRDYITVHSIA
ncbi:MAG: TIGR00725 family protein [Flammeovirgaceae bacterium]|nr:TIGR00725 family protein [Flammeovirgaceae bacterium]